jgi:hypothetical protein
MKEEQIILLNNIKYLVGEMSKIQTQYFDILLDNLDLLEDGEDWLFDYIFNQTTEQNSFEEYLEGYGKKLSDIYHE